jgi:hypothetical protein
MDKTVLNHATHTAHCQLLQSLLELNAPMMPVSAVPTNAAVLSPHQPTTPPLLQYHQ